MFAKEKNSILMEKAPLASATLISAGTVLTGDVNSESDLRIDGTINGNVSSAAKIIVGPSGCVEGNISSVQADICGTVVGNITVKELLQLKGQCSVEGNIIAAKLQVEPTATFNGKCQMGAQTAVVQMNEKDVATAKAK